MDGSDDDTCSHWQRQEFRLAARRGFGADPRGLMSAGTREDLDRAEAAEDAADPPCGRCETCQARAWPDVPAGPTAPVPPTHREILHRVRDHLLRQGRRATCNIDPLVDPTCRNHLRMGDTVLMCGVGFLIPPSLYDEACEELQVRELGPYLDPELGLDLDDHMTLCMLMTLRWIHDSEPPARWASIFEAVDRALDQDGRWTPRASSVAITRATPEAWEEG